MVMAAILPALAVILLWCIYFVDETFQLELSNYAVLPRHTKGLVGILVAPLLHDHSDHLQHLWNNSIAVFMLGWSLMYFYPRKAGSVIAFVWLFGGACVWLMGRENYHLGGFPLWIAALGHIPVGSTHKLGEPFVGSRQWYFHRLFLPRC